MSGLGADDFRNGGATAGDGGGISLWRTNGVDVLRRRNNPANWTSVDITNNIIIDNNIRLTYYRKGPGPEGGYGRAASNNGSDALNNLEHRISALADALAETLPFLVDALAIDTTASYDLTSSD